MSRKLVYIVSGILGVIILILIIYSLLFSIGGFANDIAVIPLYGQIGYDPYGQFGFSDPDNFKEMMDKANDDPSISAIVLDINSPGGSPVASDEMVRVIKNSEKPVVAWISEGGLSAAYLVASACDKIVASDSSIVGSIGVIMELSDNTKYYEDLGKKPYSITGGEFKDIGADYRPMTPEEEKILQNLVDDDYNHFIKSVSQNRHLSFDYVKSLSDGRIFSGKQAFKLKLIDQIGGKEDAMKLACNLSGANPDNYNVQDYGENFLGFNDLILGYTSKFAYCFGKGMGDSFSLNNFSGTYKISYI